MFCSLLPVVIRCKCILNRSVSLNQFRQVINPDKYVLIWVREVCDVQTLHPVSVALLIYLHVPDRMTIVTNLVEFISGFFLNQSDHKVISDPVLLADAICIYLHLFRKIATCPTVFLRYLIEHESILLASPVCRHGVKYCILVRFCVLLPLPCSHLLKHCILSGCLSFLVDSLHPCIELLRLLLILLKFLVISHDRACQTYAHSDRQ